MPAVELAAGVRIGVYEIIEPIGAGGMGEVYRARDTRLGRDVAIKILAPAVSNDSDRRRRFEREAKILASLNHPNIAAIYGVVDAGDDLALVLELVPGSTLADRLARGAMPLPEALATAAAIAAALHAGHAKSVVHRDLKPANVKIGADGTVKVLDYGLARSTRPDEPVAHDSPTITGALTRAGSFLGTAAYASPEQARGGVVDTRTDIWALGCVLFEMLSGRSPFARGTAIETLSSVLEHQPDWSQLPANTPASIVQLLRRCLEKELSKRQRDAGDIQLEIDNALADLGSAREPRRRLAPMATWLGVAVAVTFIVGAALVGWPDQPSIPPQEPPVAVTQFNDSASMPSLSHDGRMVTFVRGAAFGQNAPTNGRIYVKMLPNGEPKRLTDSEGGGYPTFSADDSRIVYTSIGPGLTWDSWEVPVLGGRPQPFMPNASGLSWLDSTRLIYSMVKSGNHMGIVTSTVTRDQLQQVYLPPSPLGMAHRTAPSPDKRESLVVEMERGVWQPCRLLPVNGTSMGRRVGPPRGACTSAAWSPDGKWMYFSVSVGGAYHLWRQRYPDGEPEQITFGPTQQEGTAITPDGNYVITSMGLSSSSITLHDGGRTQPLVEEGYAMRPTMVGTNRLYYLLRSEATSGAGVGVGELWSLDVASGSRLPMFPGFAMSDYSVSADGTKVVFASAGHTGGDGVFVAALDRRTPPRRLTHGSESKAIFVGSDQIVYLGGDSTLYRMNDDGSGARQVLSEPVIYLMSVSPDGQWAAVVLPDHSAGGGTTAELRSLTGAGAIPICNAKCSLGPASFGILVPFRWSHDGKLLFVNLVLFGNGVRKTVVLPYQAGVSPAVQWPAGLRDERGVQSNPSARIIDTPAIPAYANAYLVVRPSFQSNLYRLRLPP